MAARPSFKYRPRTREELQKRATQTGSSRELFVKDKYKTWTPTEGSHRIRILPPTWEGAQHFGLDVFAHYSIGLEGSSFICLENPPIGYKKEECPLCYERKKAQEAGEDEMAQSLRPNKRVLVWMVDRDHMNDGPQIWAMPYTIDRDLANLVIDEEGDGVYEVDNPERGYDLIFKREGKDVKTKYVGTQLSRRETPLSDDVGEQNEWLDYIEDNPLPDTLILASPEHIEKEFAAGGVRPRDGNQARDRDDDKPRRGRRDDEGRGSTSRNKDGDDDRVSSRQDTGSRRSSREYSEESELRDKRIERSSRRRVVLPRTYDELEKLSEDEMIELARSQDIDLNDRKPILPQMAAALSLDDDSPQRSPREADEPPRRGRIEEREPPPRSRLREAEDEPSRRSSRQREDDEPGDRGRDREPPPRRRLEEDEPTRSRSREDDRERPREGDRINRLRRGVDSARE